MPKRLLDHDDTASLGVSLNTDGKSLNNVGKLLTALRSGKDRNATRSAIIALERWFSERLCLGDLRVATEDADDAQKKYSEWFAKHYKIFTKRLCAVVAGETTADGKDANEDGDDVDASVDAKTRVLAFAAAMECARSEHPGRLNNELYASVLTAAVCGRSFGEELLGALTSRYLVKTDVRFHTYAVVRRLAKGSKGEEHAISRADIARNLYDVLSRTPAVFDDYAESPSPGDGARENDGAAKDDDDGEDFEAMLGLMKGSASSARGDGDDAGDEGDEQNPFGSAWCKGRAVGEIAGAEHANTATRGARETKRKKGDAKKDAKKRPAVCVAADAARSEARKTNDKWADGKRHRKSFQEAWLALLRQPFPNDVYRKVLLGLHKNVVPHMPNPVLLSDFFVGSIDRGGLDGMLALNGLFVLITKHGLEYPRFYDRLYNLLDSSAFHVSNRKGFFELLDIFLKSTALPAYLAAAFAKRLARLALTAPPAGAMTCVAFVHNLLRRHPGCAVLVHRGEEGSANDMFETDPFVETERDPKKCAALMSSLWEMATLRDAHYFHQVGKLVKTISEKDLSDRVKTAELPVNELCSANYASLLSEELGARVKSAPTSFHRNGVHGLFQTPLMKRCFPEDAFSWGETQSGQEES